MSDPTIHAVCHAGVISVFKVVWSLIMSQRIVLLQLNKLQHDLWWLKFVSSICLSFSFFPPQSGMYALVAPSICKSHSQTTLESSTDQFKGELSDDRWPSSLYLTHVTLCSSRGSLVAFTLESVDFRCKIFNIVKTVYMNLKTSQASKETNNNKRQRFLNNVL